MCYTFNRCNCSANIHRGIHLLSEEATALFDEARLRIARFINAQHDEIVFVRNATEAINIVSHCALTQDRNEVVAPVSEHHSNLLPWLSRGTLHSVPLDSSGRVDLDELARKVNASTGMVAVGHVSNVTGVVSPVDYIADAVTIAREYVPSVSVEIYSLDEDDYARLCRCGLEGVTLYMETYDSATYSQVHLKGEKTDYVYRLDAIERAGRAGARRLSIGALLGLFDWRVDGFWLGLHARYIQNACWQSAVSLSFPRLKHVPARYTVPYLVSDKELVQLMLAMRLFLPEAGFNLSTREPAALRDRLIPLGVTMMSAGSSTRPGGYATYGEETLEQFEIDDHRPPAEVAAAIRAAGYEPVWKDFDYAFDDVESPSSAGSSTHSRSRSSSA